METSQLLKIFMKYERIFTWKKLILIKVKASLMDYWKSLSIIKEIMKPNGKYLRILATNQLRFEIFDKL